MDQGDVFFWEFIPKGKGLILRANTICIYLSKVSCGTSATPKTEAAQLCGRFGIDWLLPIPSFRLQPTVGGFHSHGGTPTWMVYKGTSY